jgi:predicted nucleic acid-binding protein
VARTRSTLQVAEPRGSYVARPRIVVDASVVAAVFFEEQAQAEALALLHGRSLVAPYLLDHEMASVALRKGRPSAARLEEALDAYSRLPVERHPIEVLAVVRLAARYRLTAYDAAYLWLAESLAIPLATFDASLGAAARRHLSGEDQIHDRD